MRESELGPNKKKKNENKKTVGFITKLRKKKVEIAIMGEYSILP
jgi:hypothetical protein